jgi:hypothetical protein
MGTEFLNRIGDSTGFRPRYGRILLRIYNQTYTYVYTYKETYVYTRWSNKSKGNIAPVHTRKV